MPNRWSIRACEGDFEKMKMQTVPEKVPEIIILKVRRLRKPPPKKLDIVGPLLRCGLLLSGSSESIATEYLAEDGELIVLPLQEPEGPAGGEAV